MKSWLRAATIAVCTTWLAAPAWAGEPLTRDELEELVTDKTADCRKEKDQSTCVTYFSPEGEVVQVLHDSGDRKEGRWFLDDSDRLCILWVGRIKPLCFVVSQDADGTYRMVKRDKHLSTITGLRHGNADAL